MRVEMKAGMQKKVKKYGSVLKAYRMQETKGTAVLLVLGIYFIFFGALIGIIGFVEPDDFIVWCIASAFLVGVGVLILLIRAAVRGSRARHYLSYYQKQTGYSERELQEADRELMGYSAVKLGEVLQSQNRNPYVITSPEVWEFLRLKRKPTLMYIITAHYILAVGSMNGAHLRKLEDIVAAFYSCQIPYGVFGVQHEGFFIISKQDIYKKPIKNHATKKWYGGFESGIVQLAGNWERFSAEIQEEIRKRAPHIIPFQNIVVNGIQYNLISMENWQEDWRRIQYGQ